MKRKTIFFYLILIFILILSMEFISFGLLKYVQSKDIIFKDTFQLRDYSERTNDKRLITLKKNFSKQNIDSLVNDQKENWAISENNVTNEEIFFTRRSLVKSLSTLPILPLAFSLNPSNALSKDNYAYSSKINKNYIFRMFFPLI